MFKKFFSYPVMLVLFLSFIVITLYGGFLRHHYMGGEKFKNLQNIAIFFAEIPITIYDMINYKTLNIYKVKNAPHILVKHKEKKRFSQLIPNKRNAIMILPRYDHDLNRSVVDIIDLNDFKVLHTYKHNILEVNDKITNIDEFPRIKIDSSPVRFQYYHPLIFEDGSLTSFSNNAPLFKIDFCSNLIWINDTEQFHHSQNIDNDGNIWVPGRMNPKSKYVKQYEIKNYADDAIFKISPDGKILYSKSVTEILIENKIVFKNFALNNVLEKYIDPIHLNYIEPALNDSAYWKKGDVFLSLKHQSSIIHYRPSNNKVINYIIGPFAHQHDVDIISNKEISIFNNNNFLVNNEYSEILIYNFETKKFRKLFNNQLREEVFKTKNQGLHHILNDGALMVEEQNHGRIMLFNNKGEKEWEYINKSSNGNIGYIWWSRIIEDEKFIESYKSLLKNKEC